MYMSIATLARKSRAQRGASTRSGWTLATNANGGGACHGPCNGTAPAKQKSFRLLMKNKQQGGGPNPGGTNNDVAGGNCCFTTWKEVNNPKGNQAMSAYIARKKQTTHNCLTKCIRGLEYYTDSSGVTHLGGSCGSKCDNVGCKCNCSKGMGGVSCCNVHKTMLPLSNSENIPWVIEQRTCLKKAKAAPRNPNTC